MKATDPFQRIMELSKKLLPPTVNGVSGDPEKALAGLNELKVGTGLSAVLIVKGKALDVPPPGAGLATVTNAVPVLVK